MPRGRRSRHKFDAPPALTLAYGSNADGSIRIARRARFKPTLTSQAHCDQPAALPHVLAHEHPTSSNPLSAQTQLFRSQATSSFVETSDGQDFVPGSYDYDPGYEDVDLQPGDFGPPEGEPPATQGTTGFVHLRLSGVAALGAVYNTSTSALVQDVVAVPVPLVQFLAWHSLLDKLRHRWLELPLALRLYPNFKCECRLPSTKVKTYDIRLITHGGIITSTVTSCTDHLVSTLMRAGAFPASPIRPRVAIDINILRYYVASQDWSNMSAFGFAHTMLQVWSALLYNDGIRKLVRSASIWYSALQAYSCTGSIDVQPLWARQRPPVKDDDIDISFERLLARCPACFYSLTAAAQSDASVAHPPKHPQLIVSIDGNFTQRRLDNLDHVQRSPLPPAFFISAQQVNRVRDAMKAPGANGQANPSEDETSPPTFHACSSNVLAADELAAKSAVGPCDVTGLMGLCCRHDIPLVFCDIDTPGERHHYAVALLKHLCDAVPNLSHIGVLYDIGCRFASKRSVDAIVRPKISWAVSVFHVFGHSTACQILWSPRRTHGFGWSDGEGMERIWSALSTLIVSARSMSHGDRRYTLEQRLQHQVSEARSGLMRTLTARLTAANTNKAAAIKVVNAPEVRAITLPRYSLMKLDKTPWQLPTFAKGVKREVAHALSAMSTLRRVKMSTPLPPANELPDSQRIAIQLLDQLGAVRRAQQQVQGRHTRGQRGNAIVTKIGKGLRTARAAAHELLSPLNEAARKRRRAATDPVFAPLEKAQLFTDEAYRWVARETLQYSAWWANPIVAAAIDAYEELERVEEETMRVRLESRSALLWLKHELSQAFDEPGPGSASLERQRNLARLYLAWYPPRARARFAPSTVRKYPWPLPQGLRDLIKAAVTLVPVNLIDADEELAAEAGHQIASGLLDVHALADWRT